MQATLTNYRWISEIFHARGPVARRHRDQEASGDAQSLTHATVDDEEYLQPQKKEQHLTPCEKKRIHKAKLSYKKEWETNYP